MRRLLSILMLTSVVSCAHKPPVFNSERTIVDSTTPNRYAAVPEDINAWLNSTQLSKTLPSGIMLQVVDSYDSALGKPCKRIKTTSTQTIQFAVTCQYDESWHFINLVEADNHD